MLRIRFFRTGRRKRPFYKIVVTDKNNPPAGGRFVEDVGYYDPLTKECKIKEEQVIDWIEKGAQPSDAVQNLLIKKGIIKGKKVDVASKKKGEDDSGEEKEEKVDSPEGKKEEESKEEESKEEESKEEESKEEESKEEETTPSEEKKEESGVEKEKKEEKEEKSSDSTSGEKKP